LLVREIPLLFFEHATHTCTFFEIDLCKERLHRTMTAISRSYVAKYVIRKQSFSECSLRLSGGLSGDTNLSCSTIFGETSGNETIKQSAHTLTKSCNKTCVVLDVNVDVLSPEHSALGTTFQKTSGTYETVAFFSKT